LSDTPVQREKFLEDATMRIASEYVFPIQGLDLTVRAHLGAVKRLSRFP
jgi:hypothetical protein